VIVLAEAGFRPVLTLTAQPQTRPGRTRTGSVDHRVGKSHNLRTRSIVALQPHEIRLGKAPGETQQWPCGGTGKRVDRLIRVTDDGQIVTATQPSIQQPLL